VGNVEDMVLKYSVNEIFNSIQGEGVRSGQFTTFVRFAECNQQCVWCDTNFSDSVELTAMEICEQIIKLKCSNVEFTGGEPLLFQDAIIEVISYLRYNIKNISHRFSIQTNGTILPERSLLGKSISWSISPKFGSSGCEPNWEFLTQFPMMVKKSTLYLDIEYKFVIGCEDDVPDVFRVFEKLHVVNGQFIKPEFIIQPVFGSDSEYAHTLARLLVENYPHERIRLMCQQHKVLGVR